MSDLWLYKDFSMLPADLKQQVADFIEFLKSKQHKKKQRKSREFGCAKGYFKMSPDFDQPLEDFKDYM